MELRYLFYSSTRMIKNAENGAMLAPDIGAAHWPTTLFPRIRIGPLENVVNGLTSLSAQCRFGKDGFQQIEHSCRPVRSRSAGLSWSNRVRFRQLNIRTRPRRRYEPDEVLLSPD